MGVDDEAITDAEKVIVCLEKSVLLVPTLSDVHVASTPFLDVFQQDYKLLQIFLIWSHFCW